MSAQQKSICPIVQRSNPDEVTREQNWSTWSLANRGHLWAPVCGRGQIALSPKCVTLHCDAAWAEIWLHMSWTKHLIGSCLCNRGELTGWWVGADQEQKFCPITAPPEVLLHFYQVLQFLNHSLSPANSSSLKLTASLLAVCYLALLFSRQLADAEGP